MGDMTTFGNNDSVFSHGEDSISMLNRLAEIAKEAFKYIPEKDCTVECGTFVDVDTHAFLSAVQHFRESIEAYRDLCDELEDDKDEIRHEYEEKVVQFFNRFMNVDLTDETNYRAGELARLVHLLDNQAGELNKELEKERERSNQLEAQVKVLTTERDLAKKVAKQKSEELKEYKDDRPKLLGQIRDLSGRVHEIAMERDSVKKFWEKCYLELFRQLHESEYFDTDIAHMYPKTTINNPANFCGNCRHYAQMGKDDGDFEGICTQHYIKRVDPDDASCPHFKYNQVDRDKPDQPCCKSCNRDDCDNCTLCPF